MKKKMNCWEFMKCGRELKGERAKELGVCPAAIYPLADGINGGINGGRICWVLVGSYSYYTGKSLLCQKKTLCHECAFYKKVMSEEGLLDFKEEKKKTTKKRAGIVVRKRRQTKKSPAVHEGVLP